MEPIFIAEPPNPATPETDVVWFDSGDGTFEDYRGIVADLLFDQDVTVFIETAAEGAPLRVMNGGGNGEVVPANTPTEVRIGFLGRRTRLRLRTGATPPTLWHVNGMATQRDAI